MCAFVHSHVISLKRSHKTEDIHLQKRKPEWFMIYEFSVLNLLCFYTDEKYIYRVLTEPQEWLFAIYTITYWWHRVTFYRSLSCKTIGALAFPFFFSPSQLKSKKHKQFWKLVTCNIAPCPCCYTTTQHDCIVPKIFYIDIVVAGKVLSNRV